MSLLPDRRPENLLGLPSRVSMPSAVRKERDEELAKSVARTQVIEADIRGLEHAGTVAVVAVTNVSQLAEVQAARVPHDRARSDAVADTVAIGIQQKIAELASVRTSS